MSEKSGPGPSIERAALLSAIFESAEDAIIAKALDGTILEWNPGAERLFGYAAGEAIGRSVTMLIPADLVAEESWILGRIAAGQRVSHYETRRRRKDGSLVDISLTISPIYGAKGEIVGASKIARDITERRRAEENLRASEERFAKAFDTLPIGMTLTNLDDGRIIEANHAAARLIGYPREQLIGRTTLELDAWLFPADRERFVAELRDKGRVIGLDSRARSRAGEMVELRRYAEMISVGGRPYLLTAVLDITAEKQAQAEIAELNALLEQRVAARTHELDGANRALKFANAELEAYAYTVAHDLRAPVRVIDGFSALLSERLQECPDREIGSFVDRIRSRTQHMNRLIDDLLRLSRLSLKPLEREWVDAREEVRAVIRELDLDDTPVRLEIDDLPRYHADRAMMRQVWTNLLSNAAKYARDVPSPRVRVGFDAGAYAVRDNGVGFNPVYADKLFQVFTRLHTEAQFEGTGIGLAIVRRIVERHGGAVWAHGEEGRGATFCFTVPPGEGAGSAAPPDGGRA